MYAGKLYYFWILFQHSDKVLQKSCHTHTHTQECWVEDTMIKGKGHIPEVLHALGREERQGFQHHLTGTGWIQQALLTLLCSHHPSWGLCLAQSSSGITSSRKLSLTNSSIALYHSDFLGGSEGQTERWHAEQMEMKCPFSRTWSIVFLLFKHLPPPQRDQQLKSSPLALCASVLTTQTTLHLLPGLDCELPRDGQWAPWLLPMTYSGD